MKKKNALLGLLIATFIIFLALQPVGAQAVSAITENTNDAESLLIMGILAPIWLYVGRKAGRELEG